LSAFGTYGPEHAVNRVFAGVTDRVTPVSIEAELHPDEVRDILGAEIARRNGRDYDRRNRAAMELTREVRGGVESLSSIGIAIEWRGPEEASAAAPKPRPSPAPSAIDLVGADL
jgi:hypothetical protein